MKFCFEKNENNLKEVKIPSYLASSGKRRMVAAATLIGIEPAKKLAKYKEYILSDELVDGLHLSGLQCSDEIRCLSPKRWLESFDKIQIGNTYSVYRKEWEEQGKALKGIRLTKGEIAELERFLSANKSEIDSPWDLLEIVDHLFFTKYSEFTLMI